MRLHYIQGSPFARMARVALREYGIACEECLIEEFPPPAQYFTINPLGQVPTLITDDGQMLADSRVICEYLDHLGGNKLFPRNSARWQAIVDQAMADGILGAALLARYETFMRPGDKLWPEWLAGQMDKIKTTLASLDAAAPKFGDRCDIGTISYASALSYLDLRFAAFDWRSAYPAAAMWHKAFETRPSLVATKLVG